MALSLPAAAARLAKIGAARMGRGPGASDSIGGWPRADHRTGARDPHRPCRYTATTPAQAFVSSGATPRGKAAAPGALPAATGAQSASRVNAAIDSAP